MFALIRIHVFTRAGEFRTTMLGKAEHIAGAMANPAKV
jgi:hypothetical protein